MTNPVLSVSSRTRRTHFTPRVEACGVKGYTVYNHMLLATVFRSVEEDYEHLKKHVQIWDVSCERQVEITGPDAYRLVQMMTCRDLSKAVHGQCFYAPLVDESGAMINDPIILKLADDRFWLSIADSDVKLWAKGIATGLGLDVSVFEPDVSPLAIQGPKADDLMAEVFGEDIRSVRFFRYAYFDFQGHPFLIARSGWSKQGGFEIYVDRPDLALPLWDAIWEAGQAYNIGPGCPNLIERIEGSLFSYGNDMTDEHNPFECGLDKYVSLSSDADFMGRKALEDIADNGGPTRKLRGLLMEGNSCPPCVDRWPVIVSDAVVGTVSSAAYSPYFEAVVAIAMVDKAHWDVGSKVTVDTPIGIRSATVCDLPFV
ncbi:dimethylsulfoniopropionate demethylase [Coralliovum pocilloporae]|uniref:dimethylsulfoniopropionate demethylase n=1 Tax=Coralliovum pocilloporae TaxID=3066369 RepID=UPI003306FE60